MATKINLSVIDQFFAAQLSMNESEETIKALRPQVEAAVQALIAERGLPKNYTGTIEYHGFKIVVSRPKSYPWEQNNQIDDPNLTFYKQMHGYYEQLQANLKETSLYDLAILCGIDRAREFVQRFIDHEREAFRP